MKALGVPGTGTFPALVMGSDDSVAPPDVGKTKSIREYVWETPAWALPNNLEIRKT